VAHFRAMVFHSVYTSPTGLLLASCYLQVLHFSGPNHDPTQFMLPTLVQNYPPPPPISLFVHFHAVYSSTLKITRADYSKTLLNTYTTSYLRWE
jgi:hypothetical protein